MRQGSPGRWWRAFGPNRKEGRGASFLYFTKALVLAALPGIVEDMDGELVLRNDPAVLETKRRRKVMARDEGEGAAVVKAKRTQTQRIYLPRA